MIHGSIDVGSRLSTLSRPEVQRQPDRLALLYVRGKMRPSDQIQRKTEQLAKRARHYCALQNPSPASKWNGHLDQQYLFDGSKHSMASTTSSPSPSRPEERVSLHHWCRNGALNCYYYYWRKRRRRYQSNRKKQAISTQKISDKWKQLRPDQSEPVYRLTINNSL